MSVNKDTGKRYEKFQRKPNSPWEYGDSILYRMCNDNPKHNREDVIIGKIWIIGRSFAAAIERRKGSEIDRRGDFYIDVVAPKMLKAGKELDKQISALKRQQGDIEANLSDVLHTHKYLLDVFKKMTKLEKRSLASKYLHFHCPDMFFIYDSRARDAVRTVVKRPDKSILSGMINMDEEYADFVCRMLELQNYLKKSIRVDVSPRKLDRFLLSL